MLTSSISCQEWFTLGVNGGVQPSWAVQSLLEHRLDAQINHPSFALFFSLLFATVFGLLAADLIRRANADVDLIDQKEDTKVAWCTLDEVYQHFEELAQIRGGCTHRSSCTWIEC